MSISKRLFEAAVPVPCGNVWDSLTGEQRQRFCDTCERHVYNLVDIAEERDIERLLQENPERVCVVYEKPVTYAHPLWLKTLCAVIPVLLLCIIPASAQSKTTKLEPCPSFIQNYHGGIMTPRMPMPEDYPKKVRCLDESGRSITARTWLKRNPMGWLPKNSGIPASEPAVIEEK